MAAIVAVAAALAAAGLVALDRDVRTSGARSAVARPSALPAQSKSPRSADPGAPVRSPTGPVGPVATPQPGADARIAQLLPRRLARLRLQGQASLLVSDLDEGRDVVSRNPGAPVMPASLAKLATAVTALAAIGPATRFTTTLLVAPDGSLVLRGGGDPLLTSADLRTLARSAVARLRPRRTDRPRRVLVDDSLFGVPTRAPGWTTGYDLAEVSPVRALAVDRRRGHDTALLAGRVLATAWGAVAHVPAPTVVRRGRTPSGSRLVARLQGRPVSAAVRAMLQVSDNDIAEALGRQVALTEGYRADWQGAQKARAEVLARLGIPLSGVRLLDGSGLSRGDRIPAYALAALLRLAVDPAHPELAAVSSTAVLPVAGRTGSLRAARGRFVTGPSRCATGRLWAKTGLLRDVVGLAGYARSREGHLEAFVILVNGPRSTLALRQRVDALAATVTGCW